MEEIIYVFTDEEETIKRSVGKPKGTKGGGRPKKKPEDKLMGRPQSYTILLGNEICEWLSSGRSLTSFCAIDGSPSYSTIMRWLWRGEKWFKEEFSNNYKRAREEQAQCMVDQLNDIADDSTNDYMKLQDKSGKKYIKVDNEHIARSKLRVDTRQWIAKNLLPKVYGDKADLKLTGGGSIPVTMTIIHESKKPPDEKD